MSLGLIRISLLSDFILCIVLSFSCFLSCSAKSPCGLSLNSKYFCLVYKNVLLIFAKGILLYSYIRADIFWCRPLKGVGEYSRSRSLIFVSSSSNLSLLIFLLDARNVIVEPVGNQQTGWFLSYHLCQNKGSIFSV